MGIHNREPLRQKERVASMQAKNHKRVLEAIARLSLTGKPFSKQEVLLQAGLYVTGHRARTYIDRAPELSEAYQAAMQKMEVGA
ncbi:MAG: hypothetical protein KME27_10905 [Lyngbya sp. HA4199-MV5]|jgi:hypothetical protein|nr:hypothetical protein [Lyngbya sp. HA4199-MV5]